ncbi:MAG: phosphopantothenoylcysteine decarboxylase [Planctomycetota bacterium]
MPDGTPQPIKALVTAGPTEEPIDEVRFVGNRSSGRMGIAIAEALAARGVAVTLALGPVRVPLPGARFCTEGAAPIEVVRFRTAADLEELMRARLGEFDLVVMAAAVADYRPRVAAAGKLRRTAETLALELEPVPDLLAATHAMRRSGARVVGFALEPAERLESSALDKLARKDLWGIVANPLETMESPDIAGTLFTRAGRRLPPAPRMPKGEFARWLAAEITGEAAEQG